MDVCKRFLACAIHFGTTNSSCAFSFTNRPKDVKAIGMSWSHKVPTIILLDPQKRFFAFGGEAEDKYANLIEANRHDDWFLFREFKTVLYDVKDITGATLIEDVTGKKVGALTVYSQAIKYMVNRLSENCLFPEVRWNNYIQYVLTVPPIWNDKAKQFMREAATMAGLQEDHVSLVVESEAATTWVELETVDSMKLTTSDKPFIVADLNDRTSSITVLQKLKDGTLKQLYYTDNDPVHTTPEQNFLKFLERIFGHNIIKEFIAQDKTEYEDFFWQFKNSILGNGRTRMHLPGTFCRILERSNMEQLANDSCLPIKISRNVFCFDEEIVKTFCTSTTDYLISQIKKLPFVRDIKAIIVVGDFAQNPFVKEIVKKRLPKLKLITSEDAVLQGAVMFGHSISSSSCMFYPFPNPKARPTSRPIVCAIDFGTTYSGYAYSYKDEPIEVLANDPWPSGSAGLMSDKTPTCVLLDPQKNFVAFGFEAEDKYATLAVEDKHTDWFLFRRFKMELYAKKDITRNAVIEDIRGNKVKALTVFSYAIGDMVKKFRTAIELKLGRKARAEDIHYVLTVPAIWNDKAKQFMRKAATMAGLPGSQVSIALEPEAASVWCQSTAGNLDKILSDTDTQYIIADLGGGTADITAHQKLGDGSLKELYRASGGPFGGTLVDRQYLTFLVKIFGQDVMERFIYQETSDYIDLLRLFEVQKRSVKSDSKDKIHVSIPHSLVEISETVNESKVQMTIQRSAYSSQVTLLRGRLLVEVEVFREFFTPALDGIISHVRYILQKPELSECKIIVLVGGFAICPLVHDAFKKTFPNIKLIVPSDVSLAVVKGAVLFGYRRNIICNRRSKYAYGIAVCDEFDWKILPRGKILRDLDESMTSNVFCKLVNLEEELFEGKESTRTHLPHHVDCTSLDINVYCSEHNDTRFVDEPGCYHLGTIEVPLPVADTREDKAVTVRMKFWGTEITVVVKVDKTGEEYDAIIDCI